MLKCLFAHCILAVLALALGSCPRSAPDEERYSVLEENGIRLAGQGPASLPGDWPGEIDLPSGAKLAASESGVGEYGPFTAVQADYGGEPQAAMAELLSGAQKAGFANWNLEYSPESFSGVLYKNGWDLLLEYPVGGQKRLAVVLVKSEDGPELPSQSIGAEGELPPGFPSARVPLYPAASISFARYDKVGLAELELSSKDDPQKLSQWYEAELARLGYSKAEGGGFAENSSYSEFSSGSEAVYIEYSNVNGGGSDLSLTYKTQNYVDKIGIWD